MIAEHTFVTTFEEDEALAAAADILGKMGFSVTTYQSRLVAKRGVENPAKALRERNLPQQVELAFDRGRCHLAASILLNQKPKPIHRGMITSALTTIECVLVNGMADEQALEEWLRVDGYANATASQTDILRAIIFWFVVGVLGLLLFSCLIGVLVAAVAP